MCRLAALEIKHVLYRVPLNVVSAFHMQPHADPYTAVKNTWESFFPWALHYYLRILIRPLRNWWHSHYWLHVTDREWKTQEMPKHKQANCSITKKGRKHCFFLVIYRNFKVLLSYKSFWATSLPKDGCAFEGESWKIRPWVIKRMLVPLQTNSIAEEIKWCPRIR